MERKHFIAFALAFVMVLGTQVVRAQYAYTFGGGLRAGSPLLGVTVKGFLGNQSAIEGIVHFGTYGVGTTALYEYHFYFPGAPGLRWYCGAGGHFATGRYNTFNPFADGNFARFYFGVDGVLGMEYVFEHTPLSISLDVVPLLNLSEHVMAWWNAGLSVRYVIR